MYNSRAHHYFSNRLDIHEKDSNVIYILAPSLSYHVCKANKIIHCHLINLFSMYIQLNSPFIIRQKMGACSIVVSKIVKYTGY